MCLFRRSTDDGTATPRSDERLLFGFERSGTQARRGKGVELAQEHAGIVPEASRAGATIRRMATPRVTIQTHDFDLGHEVAGLRAGDPGVGAVVSFVGTVRDRSDGQGVSCMELEHYPGMTEKAIEAMIDAARARFDIRGARVIHRVGPLQPQDQIVLVVVSSAHRGQAFQACEFLMDYLKTQAPFWKKEHTPEGARWVDARVHDDQALARWGISSQNAAESTAA